MHTLARALVLSSWMTCSAQEEKQDLLTVQVVEWATLTTAMDMLMMLEYNVNQVGRLIQSLFLGRSRVCLFQMIQIRRA